MVDPSINQRPEHDPGASEQSSEMPFGGDLYSDEERQGFVPAEAFERIEAERRIAEEDRKKRRLYQRAWPQLPEEEFETRSPKPWRYRRIPHEDHAYTLDPFSYEESSRRRYVFANRVLFIILIFIIVYTIFALVYSKAKRPYLLRVKDPVTYDLELHDRRHNTRIQELERAEMLAIKEALAEENASKNVERIAGVDTGFYQDPNKIQLSFDRSHLNSSQIYILDLDDNSDVFAWKADRAEPVGAINQIVTGLLFIEAIRNPYRRTIVPADIVRYLYTVNAHQIGFAPGEECYMIDLAYGLLLDAGTECAMSAAYYTAGSQDAFAAMMNQRFEEWKLSKSKFSDSTGLDTKSQYASPRDLAHFYAHAIQNSRYLHIASERKHTTLATEKHPEGIEVENRFLEYFDKNPVPGVTMICGRSGYVIGRGRQLISYGEKNGRHYIVVTLGAKRDGNSYSGTDAYEDHALIYSEMLR